MITVVERVMLPIPTTFTTYFSDVPPALAKSCKNKRKRIALDKRSFVIVKRRRGEGIPLKKVNEPIAVCPGLTVT